MVGTKYFFEISSTPNTSRRYARVFPSFLLKNPKPNSYVLAFYM